MIIRSQSKKRIINFEQITSLKVSNNKIEVDTLYSNLYITIAEYDTEKRAVEVLDEIQNCYIHSNPHYEMPIE
jgi:hypothetical protein